MTTNDQYTPGRIEAKQILGGSTISTVERDKFGYAMKVAGFVSAVNARRLVACWNACEHLETESIEKLAGGGGVQRLARLGEKVALQLTETMSEFAMLRETVEAQATDLGAARGLLVESMAENDRIIKGLTDLGLEHLLDPVAVAMNERIRAFLKEKA